MSLSDQGRHAESQVIVRLRPSGPPPKEEDRRFTDLEARMERLESTHLTALDLVRQALGAIKQTQAKTNSAQARAMAQLAARLGECEATLERLGSDHKRDDETMRERLFDMGEALESVRAMASAAVRPGALRRLERTLGADLEARTESLRSEMDERVEQAVEAAESRSAQALDVLEEYVWDDMSEIARRFDSLADNFLELRSDMERRTESAVAAAGEESPAAAEVLPVPATADNIPDPVVNEEEPAPSQDMEPAAEDEATPETAVIPFPPQGRGGKQLNGADDGDVAQDVAAVLSAAVRRADESETAEAPQTRSEAARGPFARLMTSAGSAVMAVCIMSGLSLLAGPVIGPNLQDTPPAFAHGSAEWSPVTVTAQPIAISPRLRPIVRPSHKFDPAGTAHTATSGR